MGIKPNTRINYHYDNVYDIVPQRYSEIMLYQFGEISCEGEFICEAHKQWCHEITYMISGEMTASVDGQTYVLHEGDILISPLNRIHEIRVKKNVNARYAYLAFLLNESSAKDEFKPLRDFYSPNMVKVFAKDQADISYMIFRSIDEYYHKYPGYQIVFECYIKQILILTRRSFMESGFKTQYNLNAQHSVGAVVYSVICYIEENLCEIDHIQDIADALGYSNSYISALFKKKMNTTLQQFIVTKRVEKAAELLRYGNLSVTQIALRLNFANVQSFSRTFSKVKHVSPKRYVEMLELEQQFLQRTASLESDG